MNENLEFEIGDEVLVANDYGTYTGVLSGYADIAIDRFDPGYHRSDAGTTIERAIVRLTGKSGGGVLAHHVTDNDGYDLGETERFAPRIDVEYMVVETHLLRKPTYYVTVYNTGRSYGGPEEGGWYYDTGYAIMTKTVSTRWEAEGWRDALTRTYKHDYRYGHDDYMVTLSITAPDQEWSNYKPWS